MRRAAGRDDVPLGAAARGARDRARAAVGGAGDADARAAARHHRADARVAAAVRLAARRASPWRASTRTRASTACSGSEEDDRHRAGRRGVPGGGHRRARARSRPTRCSCAPTRGEFDVVVACYHDQGLVPVKLLAFGESVNVTLGLPIIRTSVDHGTAFDIAGHGARPITASLRRARIRLAARPGEQRRGRSRTEAGHASDPDGSGRRKRGRQTIEWPTRPSARRRRRSSPTTARRSTTTTSSTRWRRAWCCYGTEVKSIREGRVNLRDSYGKVEDGEIWVYNINISPYSHRGYADHEPLRRRKLLLHKRRDPQAHREDGRARLHPGAAAALLQERPREGRARASRRARPRRTSARRSAGARSIARRVRPSSTGDGRPLSLVPLCGVEI